MPTQLISIGPPTTLIQNVVYALPAQLVQVTTSSACQTSVDQSTWVAYTSDTPTSASFIRSAGVNTVVTVKSATKGGSSGGGGGSSNADVTINNPVPTLTLIDSTGSAGLRRWQISVNGTDLSFDSQNDAGVSYGRPLLISLFNGGINLAGPIAGNSSGSFTFLGLPELTFAGLPTGQGVGTLANVSDSTVNTLGATVAGGGSFHVLARWNGTIWKVAAV